VSCGRNREQRRAWKEQRRAWKRHWREGAADGPPPPGSSWGPSWSAAGGGAAYAGWHAGPRPPRHRVYRSRTDCWLAGVAGGLADHWGVASWAVRLAFVLALAMAGPFAVFGYMILAVAMRLPPEGAPAEGPAPRPEAPADVRPADVPPPEADAQDGATASAARATLAETARRLRDLDRKVATMEAVVLTREFQLGREIRSLGE